MEMNGIQYLETCPECRVPARSETIDDGRLGTETMYLCVNPKCWCYDAKWLKKTVKKVEPFEGVVEEFINIDEIVRTVPRCEECDHQLAISQRVENGAVVNDSYCLNLMCSRSYESTNKLKELLNT
jgi:hypothetical protein